MPSKEKVAKPAAVRQSRRNGEVAKAGSPNVALSDVHVVAAARKIIAKSGVDGLTMRHLSDELGVTLGATYRHVPSKRDVLLLVARDLYDEIKVPGAGSWDERLKRLMLDVAKVMSNHPGMAVFVTSNLDETMPAHLNRGVVDILRDAGFTPDAIDTVIAALFFYTYGIIASGLITGRGGAVSPTRVRQLVERGLDLMLSAARVTLMEGSAGSKR